MSQALQPINGRRVVQHARLIICLLLGLTLTACLPTIDCQTAGMETTTACSYTGPDMQNARFDVADQLDLRPSGTIWLRSGEILLPVWDAFIMKITKGTETCDFDNLTQYTDDCALCNFCDESPAEYQRCDAHPAFFGTNAQVVVFDGFIGSGVEGQAMQLDNSAGLFGGCYALGYLPTPLTPTTNSTFRLLAPEYSTSKFAILAQRNVFVVQNGMPQPTPYELTQYATNGVDKVWYRWTVKEDPIWEDNFSKNVRIGKVRILTGTKYMDPNTGRFQLADAKVVRPSRILFFSDFNPINGSDGSDILSHPFEDDNRCYVDDSKLDGDINLVGIPDPMMMRTRCRQDSPGPGARETEFAATPTYLTMEPGTQLTWFVEFYEQEGADFDPSTTMFDAIPADAVLAIEFTIEVVP